MLTLIVFVVVLSLLVFVHEFGHFLSARRLGVEVEEFGFGFPPRLVGRKRGQTIYSINAIPFGGFVRLKGEDGQLGETPRSFTSVSIFRRAVIIVSGVAMNFVLTIVVFIIGFTVGVPSSVTSTLPGAQIRNQRIVITQVLDSSPAQKAGLRAGDTITAINGQKSTTDDDIRSVLEASPGQDVQLDVTQSGEQRSLTVKPERLNDESIGKIGAGLETVGVVSYPLHWAVVNGVRTTVSLSGQVVVAFGVFLQELMLRGHLSPDVSGPIGIAVITGEVTKLGFMAVLQFMGLLSLSLAVINVLPFPALDGGRLFFLLLERLRGRAVNRRFEAIMHNVGFALLILFVLAVSVQDVRRFDIGQRIGDAIRGVFQS